MHAVLGNNDHELAGVLPETLRLRLGGLTVGMVHDAGPARSRAARLGRLFDDCGLVVYGHSHIPMLERVDGRVLLNPGSPTDKRHRPEFTLATLKIESGRVLRPRIVPLDVP